MQMIGIMKMKTMRNRPTKQEVIEQHTVLFATQMTKWDKDPLGIWDNTTLIPQLIQSMLHCIDQLGSWDEGMMYAGYTLSLSAQVAIVKKDILIPSIYLMGLKSFEDNDRWKGLIEAVSKDEQPIAEIVYTLSNFGLLSFSEVVTTIRDNAFSRFLYLQGPNIYHLQTQQAIILLTLDSLGIVPYEIFYNNVYE